MHKWTLDECSCPIAYTLSVVGGKWNWLLLYKLFQHGTLRYSELRRLLPPITHKMLSQQLKELAAGELIRRNEYPQVPPKVEYSLTAKGETLIPVLQQMSQWGRDNRPQAEDFRPN